MSTGDDEARTIDSLAKKAGQLYAKGEHDRTRGVRSLGKLADWKTKDLLNDDWSRRMLAAAIRTADAYEAWSGRPIPLGSLAGFVLRGDIDSLQNTYPLAPPVAFKPEIVPPPPDDDPEPPPERPPFTDKLDSFPEHLRQRAERKATR
ncbi:MAG: hypothetical protein KA129_10090 [Microthrixaceae bacterium]|nr:hypothetical protein [Microthrixaceae bacterium]